MTIETQPSVQKQFSIHPATLPGHVALTVANLDNQVLFYQQVLGLQLHWRDGNQAGMGAGGADLLRMTQPQETGLKRYRHVTGLYHFAVLFPSRRELARAIARLFSLRWPNSPTDHIMTKTTYLDDPEGNGIELYAESPEDGMFTMEDGKFVTRRADGSESDGREPLDVDALFKLLTEDDALDQPVPEETRIGHVHLHIRNLDEAVDFYHGVLGFDVMGTARLFRAAFVSAGGYHHHIGLNTWQGEGIPSAPADSVGLHYFSVVLPDKPALDAVLARVREAGFTTEPSAEGTLVRDLSNIAVVLTHQTA